MYKYALFDFDGVIVNSEPIRLSTYQELFLDVYGSIVKIDKYSMIGKPESYNLTELLKKNNLSFDTETILNLKKKRQKILIRKASQGFPIIDSVYEIIKTLKKIGVRLAIVTNSSYKYVIMALRAIGLKKEDFLIVSGNDASLPKPNPELYLRSIELLSCKNTEVLAFEDSPAGIQAAENAGIDVVVVSSSFEHLNSEFNYRLDCGVNSNQVQRVTSLFGAIDA